MKTRWLGNAYILALSLAMFFWAGTAAAQNSLSTYATSATYVTTGNGGSSGGGEEVCGSCVAGGNFQWVAAQFTLAQPAALGTVTGFFGITSGVGSMNLVIRTNDTRGQYPVPGVPIWSQNYQNVGASHAAESFITFSNYIPVLAPGTYWLSFEPPKGSGMELGMDGPAQHPLPPSSYAFYNALNGHFINFADTPNTNYPALSISGLTLTLTSGAPVATFGTAARTVTQGSLYGTAFSNYLPPIGDIGQPFTNQWNIYSGAAQGNAYGSINNYTHVAGTTLTAGAYTATGTGDSAGSRGIVFATFVNVSGSPISNVQVNGVLNGNISGAGPSAPVRARANVYVFDTGQFSNTLNTAVTDGNTVAQFLLGGIQVVAGYGSDDYPDLSQLFPSGSLVDTSYGTTFPEQCTSSCAGPYLTETQGFYLDTNALFTVMFDVSAASLGAGAAEGLGIGNFLDTLAPDPTKGLFSDGTNPILSGIAGPVALVLVPTPAGIAFSPATVSAPIGSTANVTALVTDGTGAPLPNANVTFAITSGPHIGYSSPVGTDANGNATLPLSDTLGTPGTDTITASIGSLQSSNTGSIDWTSPGPPFKITLSPLTTSISPGTGQTYVATGTDFFGNPTGDVTTQLTFTIAPDGSCTFTTVETCTPATTATHTVTGTYNYPLVGPVSGTATLNVGTTSSLTITASSASMAYGGTVPTITATYTYGSVVNSLTPPSDLTAAPTCSTTATSSTPVGTYTGADTCLGAVDPNYTITYVAGNMTVSAEPVTITATNTTMTYGGSAPTPSALYSYGSVSGSATAPAGLAGTTCSTTATSTTPVGTDTGANTCSGASGSNYTISYAAGNVTVSGEPVTITASNTSMTYGSTPPKPTPAYTYGSVSGSATAPAGLTAPTCVTSATSTTPVGTDTGANTCSGASGSNYSISYVAGNVTVSAEPVTITASNTSMTQGSTPPTPTPEYTYGNVTLSPTAPTGLTGTTCSTTATNMTPVGTDSGANTCSGASGSNYSISYVAGNVVVNPAGQTPTFTITPNPAAETVTRGVLGGFILKLQSVDGFNANVKLSCSGGPAGSYCVNFPMTVKVNGTAYAVSGILFPKHSNPGTYVITFTGVSGSLTVKATATFTVK